MNRQTVLIVVVLLLIVTGVWVLWMTKDALRKTFSLSASPSPVAFATSTPIPDISKQKLFSKLNYLSDPSMVDLDLFPISGGSSYAVFRYSASANSLNGTLVVSDASDITNMGAWLVSGTNVKFLGDIDAEKGGNLLSGIVIPKTQLPADLVVGLHGTGKSVTTLSQPLLKAHLD
ncbi:MAG TPA: hypothetical protein VLH19_03585 [Patescibacteria group bacterium]|nr:hypothetical protein [Patescibacteria group bacterium]